MAFRFERLSGGKLTRRLIGLVRSTPQTSNIQSNRTSNVPEEDHRRKEICSYDGVRVIKGFISQVFPNGGANYTVVIE